MGVMRRRSVRTPDVLGGNTILPPKTAEPGRNLREHRAPGAQRASLGRFARVSSAACHRGGPRAGAGGGADRSPRRTWRWSGRSAGCSPRTCAAGMDVPPVRQLGDGRLRAASPGPRPSCRWWASRAPATPSARRVEPGAAVRISTGAVVPEGADAVVPVERTEAAGERVRVPDTEAGRQRAPRGRGRARGRRGAPRRHARWGRRSSAWRPRSGRAALALRASGRGWRWW